jgi:hypothetical protein
MLFHATEFYEKGGNKITVVVQLTTRTPAFSLKPLFVSPLSLAMIGMSNVIQIEKRRRANKMQDTT